MRRLLQILFVLIFVLAFSGISCGKSKREIRVRDMVGRKVTVPQDPARIICIGPGTLRLIIYLGAKDRVVGVEDIEKRFPTSRPYWIANSEMEKLPAIGPGGVSSIDKMPDLEAILAVHPDVIFISYMKKKKADLLQHRIAIPVIVLSYGTFGSFNHALYDSLRVAGRVLSAEERALDLIAYIKNTKKDLLKRVRGYPEAKKPRVYVGCLGFRGMHGIGSTETNYAPFEWVRARNLAKGRGHMFVGKEKILSWDPDILFIDGGGGGVLRQDYERRPEFYHALKAFRNRKVYSLYPFNWYMTNIGTVICDAYAVGKILYPERFADVDLKVRADKIYRFLLRRPIYAAMYKKYGRLGQVLPYVKDLGR